MIFCAGIGKTPTKTYKHLKQSARHRNVNHFLVLKWHISFSDRWGNVMDNVQEGRPSSQNCRAVQNEFLDVIDVDQRLTVHEVAENVSKTTVTVDDILSENQKMSRVCAR